MENEKMTQTAVRVNHQQLEDIIVKYYKAKRALFIWGTMGIGKSHTVRAAAKRLAKELSLEYTEDLAKINQETCFQVVDIRLSQCDPSDLRGIPIYSEEKKATKWLPPSTFPRKGYGIILFDELNLAPPLVQASAYQFILDRQLGEYVVPEGFSVIGAGNRLEDRANVFEMAAPLANRMGHVQLEVPSLEAWRDWAVKNSIDTRIVAYLSTMRSSLFTFDSKLKEKAFATPRSWEFLSDIIRDIPMENLAELRMYASTLIGEGEAIKFTAFLKLRDKLRPIEEYFEQASTVTLPGENQVDLLWALITSIVEYFKAKNTEKTLKQLVELMKRFPEEYSALALKLCYSLDPSLQKRISRLPEARSLAEKLWKFVSGDS